MKHGYFVVGENFFGNRFTSGRNDTLAQIKKTYRHMMNSKEYSDQCKQTFRIVELVEQDITEKVL